MMGQPGIIKPYPVRRIYSGSRSMLQRAFEPILSTQHEGFYDSLPFSRSDQIYLQRIPTESNHGNTGRVSASVSVSQKQTASAARVTERLPGMAAEGTSRKSETQLSPGPVEGTLKPASPGTIQRSTQKPSIAMDGSMPPIILRKKGPKSSAHQVNYPSLTDDRVSDPPNASAAQTIRHGMVLTESAVSQTIPVRKSLGNTRRPDYRNATKATPSLKSDNAGPSSGARSQSETNISPAAGNLNFTTIRRQTNVQVNQGNPHEGPAHPISAQAPLSRVQRDTNLRKTADLQPVIRRLGVNRHVDGSIQRKVTASAASSSQSRSPGDRWMTLDTANSAGLEMSAAKPTLLSTEEVARTPHPSAATAGPGDLAGAIQPQRLKSPGQPHKNEGATNQKAADHHVLTPKTSRTEASPRSDSLDLGTTILRRYRNRNAGGVDKIQKIAAPLQDISQTATENRKMALIKQAVYPVNNAAPENSGAEALPASNSYHSVGPLATADRAASVAEIQTKPENTITGSSGSLPGLLDVPATGEEADSSTDMSSGNKIDMDELATKVWRKLMRQLAVESERRGLQNWHYQN